MKTYQAKVLVVDHESVVLEIVGKMLTGEGHEVDTAVNGSEALDKIKKKTYDLILQEVKFTDRRGLELYRRIKKDNQASANKVVFLTACMAEDFMDFLQKTQLPCIIKPFNIEQLKIEIDQILVKGEVY